MPSEIIPPNAAAVPSRSASGERRASGALAELSPTINLLAYVHLRNIHASTGAGRVARQMTEHLARRGDIRLRVLADRGDQERILPLVGEPWTGYRYDSFVLDTSRQQARWFALDRPRAEVFWPEAQIVYCTAESYVPTVTARLAVTVHDAAYFEESAHKRDRSFWMQQLKWRLLFSKLARHVDMFHTVSQFSADRLSHFFPTIRDRIRVVSNAVSPHFFEPVPSAGKEFLAEHRLRSRPFVLVPGGLHFRKNADLILQTLPLLKRQHPDLTVAVVNHSNPAYAIQAAQIARDNDLDLRLLGFVDDDALHALYSAAAVVWFPSRYEGFGLPVIEAMACGTPVVASDASSLPEIAGDAAVLVGPESPGDHSRALAELLGDSRARAELTEAGRRRARAFTWSQSAASLKHCFDQLL